MDLSDREKQALKIISSQHEGQVFLKALMRECGYQKPSVVLTKSNEVEIRGTIYNEARRGVWLDLRDIIEVDNLSVIELDEKKEVPAEIVKDINHERSNSSNTDPNDDINIKSVGGTVRRRRDDFDRKSAKFAEDYIAGIYPGIGNDEGTDRGGA